MTAIETLVVSGLFIVVDVPEMAWNVEIENKLMKNISSYVGGPSADASAEQAETATAEPAGSGQPADPSQRAESPAG